MVDRAREKWRNQIREAALDPNLPIVDAHHHIVPHPHRPRLESYVYEDIVADIAGSGHAIAATVHVDAYSNYRSDGPEHLRVVGETEYIAGIADREAARAPATRGIFAAIVGHADLMLGSAVGEVLDAQMAASPRLCGIRRMTIFDSDLTAGLPGNPQPDLLLAPAFYAGMSEVAARGLSFDAGVAQAQLPQLVALAQAFPEVTIILGHAGTPLAIGRYAGRAAEAFAEWHQGMTALATCPNVLVKLGGFNMAFTGLGAGNDAAMPLTSAAMADRQRRHAEATIELFGPERCMFESNFPVDKWYTSYTALWNSLKRMAQGYSVDERTALFSGTACRAYGITLPETAPAALAGA